MANLSDIEIIKASCMIDASWICQETVKYLEYYFEYTKMNKSMLHVT